VHRAFGLLFRPGDEWRAIAAARAAPLRLLLTYALPLASLSAVAWEIGVALGGLHAFGGELPSALPRRSPVAAGAVTLLGSVLSAAALALALYVIAPFYDARRSWAGAWTVAVYGATPVWLAGILLVQPVLILVVLVAMLHACYLWFLGVQAVLQVRAGSAAECVAIALIIATVLTMLVGGLLGAGGML
jgi:hypothetical protein